MYTEEQKQQVGRLVHTLEAASDKIASTSRETSEESTACNKDSVDEILNTLRNFENFN